MNPGLHGAIAAAAAAQRRKKLEKGEENMTRYQSEELEGDWEFKIVRSERRMFHKPEVLQALIQEEAAAGWQLLEKLDDNRIRFKRPAAAKRRDASLPRGVDPYRTTVGGNSAAALTIVGLMLTLVLGIGVFMFLAMEGPIDIADWSVVVILPALFLVLALAILAAVKARR